MPSKYRAKERRERDSDRHRARSRHSSGSRHSHSPRSETTVVRVNSFHASDIGSDDDFEPVRKSGPPKKPAREKSRAGSRGRPPSTQSASERVPTAAPAIVDAVEVSGIELVSAGAENDDTGGLEGPMQAFIQELAKSVRAHALYGSRGPLRMRVRAHVCAG